MSQNQQKYDYEFIKEEYNKAERVLSDIVSILKSSFDKKYILKNEDKYIQKVIAMLIDIRKIESDIKGIYFDAENDKLEEPYKGLQEIKENVKVLKWYYDRVNLLIKSYNKLYPGTIKAADKDEDIANKCYDIKLTLKKIAVEISKMIQKSKNEINEINKASDPETHTQKTKDTLDLLQKKIDKLEKDQVEVNGHIDNMKEAKSVLTKQMKITDIAVIHRYFKLLTLQEYYDAVECIEVHKQYLENGRTQKENSSASDGTTKNAGDNSNSQKNEKEQGSAESKSSDENTAKSKGSEAESDATQGKESENIGGKNASGHNYSSNSKKSDGASVNYSKPDFYKCLDVISDLFDILHRDPQLKEECDKLLGSLLEFVLLSMSPGQVVMDLKKMSGYYNDAVKFVERHKIDIGPADDMKNQNKDDLGVRDSEDAPTSTSGNAEADGTCPVDDMKNQNEDDLGVCSPDEAPTSTSGNAEADGTCTIDDIENPNIDDLGVCDSDEVSSSTSGNAEADGTCTIDDIENPNIDDLGVCDSDEVSSSTSGSVEADGTCPVDDMKNQNKDDLGVRDSEDAHYNPYHATSNESGSEAKRFMCSTSSCASIVYDSAYDDILAIGIAAKNICHEDIRKNVSSSDAASNSTVTNSTTSYIFDINFSSNMSYHEMINIISDSLGAHNDMLGY